MNDVLSENFLSYGENFQNQIRKDQIGTFGSSNISSSAHVGSFFR